LYLIKSFFLSVKKTKDPNKKKKEEDEEEIELNPSHPNVRKPNES
jgi:hypothetical protein